MNFKFKRPERHVQENAVARLQHNDPVLQSKSLSVWPSRFKPREQMFNDLFLELEVG